MMRHLDWSEVEHALDAIEQGDRAGVVGVYLTFEGRALNQHDMRGARQTINLSTFCQHFMLGRGTFRRWLHTYGAKETA